jgi:hypothetical protein
MGTAPFAGAAGRGCCMMRLTRAQREEIVSTFYGINSDTCEVETVAVTRGGKLLRHTDLSSCILTPGRQVRTEIRLMYGLTDLIEVHPQFQDTEHVKQQLDELKTKAAQMRAGFVEARSEEIEVLADPIPANDAGQSLSA